MAAIFMVRAVVPEEDRETFDQWYEQEHLPDAVQAFRALRAWRGWSDVEEGVHHAFYEFGSLERVREISTSAEIKALIAEFDRKWGTRVVRTREIVSYKQRLEGA